MLDAHEEIYLMQKLQILKDELSEWYNNYHDKTFDVICVDDWKNIDNSIPVCCSGDLLKENVRYWLTNNQPAFYVGRGYLGNHLYKQKKYFRVSLNGWANIKLSKMPYSRWDIMNLDRHKWKVKDVKNVLIAPSKMTSKVWTRELRYNWAQSLLDKFPGADVRIRYKGERPGLRWETLWDDLDWADLVVSQSSAITVEAFWYGKKVISTEPCPTWAAYKATLDDWKNPVEPVMRDAWHEHIAWSQYTVDEWKSGEVLHLIQSYLGNVLKYRSGHKYDLIF